MMKTFQQTLLLVAGIWLICKQSVQALPLWNRTGLEWKGSNIMSALFSAKKQSSHDNTHQRRNTFVSLAAAAVIGVPILAQAYARWSVSSLPDSVYDKLVGASFEGVVSRKKKLQDMAVVFHGAGGPDANTADLLSAYPRNKHSEIVLVDWSRLSKNELQASFHGERVGRATAALLAGIQNVHIIGISVGAFPAHSCVQHLSQTTNVQLTLLDPFTMRGILQPWYGTRLFGTEGAAYSQQYMNTDDPVPSTNTPLPHCATIDVTPLRPPSIFGHDWPLIYYTRIMRHQSTWIVPMNKRRPVGSVLVLRPTQREDQASLHNNQDVVMR